jgi:Ni/Fe-hydrogenase subunit HybB-like protein
MKTRQDTLKTFLWAAAGVFFVVTVVRFARGLGATTALSDAAPWGFWVAFDVMAGVALAAGGFVLAAVVYIFGRERYRPLARPAILTAFIGYVAVVLGLAYDLGLPWNIWHPVIYPQYHSALFETALCIMLYVNVLFLEFLPVILEYPWFDRPLFRKIHGLVKTFAVPLVITGIVLSTLHQSTLGSIFLISPYRLHPLWYSPIIWVLFFVSAVALGLMMVVAESYFSAWFFGHKLDRGLMSGLGKIAAAVLLVYAGLRTGDLAVRGFLGTAFDGSALSVLFLAEISVSALIPAVLLLFRRIRSSTTGLGICAGMTILGFIANRFNVTLVAFARPESMSYFPHWMEFAASLGIVAIALLIFIFFVEHLKVYPRESGEKPAVFRSVPLSSDCSSFSMRNLLPGSLRAPRGYSLAFVFAAAATAALLPESALFGEHAKRTPVHAARTVDGRMKARPKGFGHVMLAGRPGPAVPGGRVSLLVIDGNRDGRLVFFPHDHHIETLEGRKSCARCHHLTMPLDRNTSCCECHRDMYTTTDIFRHDHHIEKLDGNNGCARCHMNPGDIKSRSTALACSACHEDMLVADSLVPRGRGGLQGRAVGYMDAMHGLCIPCHKKRAGEAPRRYGPRFAECATCHRDVDISTFGREKPAGTEDGKTMRTGKMHPPKD